MKKPLRNIKELFDYLMYAYIYELEEVQTKKGPQKRLKDNELELELKNKTKENLKVKDLHVELKLGPYYNRTSNCWIQIYTMENKSGTKGRYVGISFSKENNEIEIWIGFGRSTKKQSEILEAAREYKIRYSIIEPNLKYGFEYTADNYDAVFIQKNIKIQNFKEDDFARDLGYITDLYKMYENRFENATIPLTEKKDSSMKGNMTYEEINSRMLVLIEEVGNLANAIREMGKNNNY